MHELELATGTATRVMEPHVEMLERYPLAGREEESSEGRTSYWLLGTFDIDGWDFWRDFRRYCKLLGLAPKEVINELRFDVLDA